MDISSKGGLALVVVVLMAAAVGCSDDTESSSDSSDSSTTTSTDTSTTTTAPADALVGTWRTDPITTEEAEATLTSNGLDQWVDDFAPISPVATGSALVLEIGDEWDLATESADGALVPVDYEASYEIDGDEVTVAHTEGSNTFRWVVEGDVLTLEWLSTTLPDFEGVPEEVFQRVLYETVEFTRAS